VPVREGAVENVERRVIAGVLRRRQVVREVLQLQAHRVAVVVAAHLRAVAKQGLVEVKVWGLEDMSGYLSARVEMLLV